MAYASLPDVQALIPKFSIDASTKPNTVQATGIVTQISAEMDSVVSGAGYAVPVATPAWFVDALKLLNCYGAAATILKAFFPDATGPDETPAYAYFAQMYRDGLKRLSTGDGIPPDAPTSSGTVYPSTYFTRNPDAEESLGDIAEPFFTRNKVF